eukprot:240645-Alexandrium_andersonii.AAC.1
MEEKFLLKGSPVQVLRVAGDPFSAILRHARNDQCHSHRRVQMLTGQRCCAPLIVSRWIKLPCHLNGWTSEKGVGQ